MEDLKMPKILFHICHLIYPYEVGGMEIFNYFLIKNLRSDVAVFSDREYNFPGLRYIRYRTIRPTKIFDAVQLYFTLKRNRNIQTVAFSYCETHWLLWYMNMLAVKLARRRYACIIHHGKAPSKDHINQIGKFLRNSYKVVAVSDDIKSNYDAIYGTDCTVIPPLIPFELSQFSKAECRERFGIPLDASVICQVGTVKQMKNPQTVIEALSFFTEEELEKYNPQVVFAGENHMQESLMMLIQQKGLQSRVHFLGVVPVESIKDVMRMSDLYLIASDYEGTSVSLLEAMFNSMPILAANVRGINNMVSNMDNALVFPVKDAAVLKGFVVEFLDSVKLRDSLGKNAKTSYDTKYDYSLVLNSYKKILDLE